MATPSALAFPRAKTGVLLVNLGTPDATDYWSMRRYLKEFLSDQRVIEVPKLIWWPILNLIILSVRPSAKGKDYASIWNKAEDESPLRTITRGQSDKLAAWVAPAGLVPTAAVISWSNGACAMATRRSRRASTPSSRRAATSFCSCRSIRNMRAATSATVCDKAFEALATMRFQPTMRVAHPYFQTQSYIDALAASIKVEVAKLTFKPEVLLASFHGVPQKYVDKGDPYQAQCIETWQRLRHTMGLTPNEFRMSFQSRFGRRNGCSPIPTRRSRAWRRPA